MLEATEIEPKTQGDDVYGEIQKLVGRPDGPARRAVGVVSADRIRDWCEAIGDTNPIYRDREAARACGYDDVVCPPAALMLWTMAGLENQAAAIVGPEGTRLRTILREAGYPVTLAVNCDQNYVRYLRLGERVTAEADVGAVSPRKETALGAGYFHSLHITYRSEAGGEIVGKTTMRSLSFRPRARAERPKPAAEPRVPPVVNRDTAFFWDGLQAGELRAQRCDDCSQLRNPPGPMCPYCTSLRWSPQVLTGKGTIYSFVIVHHPKLPGFEPPYGIALVDLEEGIRLVAGIIAPLQEIAVGKAVSVKVSNLGSFSVPEFILAGPAA